MTEIFQTLFSSTIDIVLFILCIITLVGVIVMVLDRFVFKSFLFEKLHHQKKIEKTTNIITEIKKIAQLVCMTYYEEQLGIMEKHDDGKLYIVHYIKGTDRNYDSLIVKYNGTILVGVDLSKIKENDIEINGNTLKARIPHSEAFEIQINPDDKTHIYEKGNWSGEAENKLYCHMKDMLKKHAIEEGVYQRSDELAIKNLSTWFKSFGYEHVEVYME